MATLASWRHLKKGPPYLRFGRVVCYREATIEEWILSQEVHPIEAAEDGAPTPEDLDDEGEPDFSDEDEHASRQSESWQDDAA